MKIELTKDETLTLRIALVDSVRDDLRLRRFPDARKRIRRCISLHRKLELARFGLKSLADLRQLNISVAKHYQAIAA